MCKKHILSYILEIQELKSQCLRFTKKKITKLSVCLIYHLKDTK